MQTQIARYAVFSPDFFDSTLLSRSALRCTGVEPGFIEIRTMNKLYMACKSKTAGAWQVQWWNWAMLRRALQMAQSYGFPRDQVSNRQRLREFFVQHQLERHGQRGEFIIERGSSPHVNAFNPRSNYAGLKLKMTRQFSQTRGPKIALSPASLTYEGNIP